MDSSRDSEFRAVFAHMDEARRHLRRLMAVSMDWTANAVIEAEFTGLEQQIAIYGQQQGSKKIEVSRFREARRAQDN